MPERSSGPLAPHRRASWVVALLVGLLAFTITLQWRQVDQTEDFSGVRGAELAELLKSLDATNARLTEQIATIRDMRPDVAALNMGTMNYSKYSQKRKAFDFDMIFPNTYGKILKLLTAMNEAGVKPELECFDTGHTHGVWPLLDMGALKPPLQFSFIVNVLGGIPAHVESLQLQTKIMPAGSEWEVIGISHGHWRMMAAALALGGNVRTGLEDHLYLPSGEMAKSNGELVDVLVRMVRDVGRTPASVEQAREILSLGSKAP